MYTDLRQYTTIHEIELEEDTYGWYIKKICERCKDKKLVEEFMTGLEDAFEHGYVNDDMNLMENLFNDFHIQDALGSDDNIFLRMMLSCYLEDFIYHFDNRPSYVQFFDYSNQGRRLSGLNKNVLSEYLDDWLDFSRLRDGTTNKVLNDAEILLQASDGTLEETYEEVMMYSSIFVCDEINDQGFDNLVDTLSFSKIEDGLYYYGVISYECDEFLWDSINEEEIESIVYNMIDKPVVNILEDDLFIMLNEEISNINVNMLIKEMKYCESTQEVLF